MNFVEDYLEELKETLNRLPFSKIRKIKDILLSAYQKNKRVFIMGNGGSAATASHFGCDLAKGTTMGKGDLTPRFRVTTLTDNVPLLTAWSNDADYSSVFLEQLRNILQSGDVVIAISASGNSENVVRATEYANANLAITVALTGFEGGKLKKIAQECLIVPSQSMERIEDVHLILEHLICSWLRNEIQPKNKR